MLHRVSIWPVARLLPQSTAVSLMLSTLSCLVLLAPRVPAQSPGGRALLAGRATEADHLLRDAIARTNQPADHLLLCRVLYSENLFDDALPECQTAADATPPSSAAYLWLGRVQGARAARANPLLAFALARKVRSAFARSVEIDPTNAAAVDDLGEYFVEAPAIVGGGIDQARALATRSVTRAPSAAHRVLALADQHADDMAAAEREFHNAISSARPSELPGAWIDLARFFVEREHTGEALAAIHSALVADRAHDAATVDAARLLLRLHRPVTEAIPLLRDYLASANQSDEAPSFKVHLELATLLEQANDPAAAEQQRALAHSLAPDFQPRHEAKRPETATGQVR